jgi:hypothetical protein
MLFRTNLEAGSSPYLRNVGDGLQGHMTSQPRWTQSTGLLLVNSLKHSGNSITRFNTQELCILPTECVYVFPMIITLNGDYLLK